MRGIGRSVLSCLVVVILFVATITTASAGSRVLDDYCSPSGDYCTFVIKKGGGAIVFEIRAFADYFGRSDACVTKDIRVCHSRAPRHDGDLFKWRIRRATTHARVPAGTPCAGSTKAETGSVRCCTSGEAR